jgi:hypothetical protein
MPQPREGGTVDRRTVPWRAFSARRLLALSVAVSAVAMTVGWGCGHDVGEIPLANAGAPAYLELRIRTGGVPAGRGSGAAAGPANARAAAVPFPRQVVKLSIQVGERDRPDFVAPPDFDVSGRPGDIQEAVVVQIPPGTRRRVRFQGKDAQGRVLISGEFFGDFIPGVITSNDIDLGVLGVAATTPVTGTSQSGQPPPPPPQLFVFVTEDPSTSGDRLSKINLTTDVRGLLFSFATETNPQTILREAAGTIVVAEGGLGMAPPGALSRIASDGSSRTVLNAGPLGRCFGVTRDAAGNFIVTGTDPVGFTGFIARVPSGGGAPTFLVSGGPELFAGSGPHGVVVDGNGDIIVCRLLGNPALLKFRGSDGAFLGVLTDYMPVGFRPRTIALTPSGNFVVGDTNLGMPPNGNIAIVTPGGVRNPPLATISGASPGQIVVTSSGNFVYPEQENNVLVELTPTGTRTVVFTFPLASLPIGVAF